MTDIMLAFADCTTNAEVNELVNMNLDFMNEHPFLFRFARNARKRINRMWRIKMELTETIYKN